MTDKDVRCPYGGKGDCQIDIGGQIPDESWCKDMCSAYDRTWAENGISCEKHGHQLGPCPKCLEEMAITDKYLVLAEPKWDGFRYLMVECPWENCRWVAFIERVNRGKKYMCECCGVSSLVPEREITQIQEEETENGQEDRDDHDKTGGKANGV